MQVKELMQKDVVTVSPEETTALAARLLARHNVGALPVTGADGKLRGIVTDRDIVLRCIAQGGDPKATPIRAVMTRDPVTVAPTDTVEHAAAVMAAARVRRLPVMENGRPTGMLALGDLAVRPSCDAEASRALTEISSNLQKR